MFQPGEKIVVYTEFKVELGEGTLIRETPHPDMGLTAYECEEHTILAKGCHYVKARGHVYFIDPDFDKLVPR